MPTDELITVQEAAIILNVTELIVRRYIKENQLRAFKLGNGNPNKQGRHWRIKRSDLDAFVEKGSNMPEKSE